MLAMHARGTVCLAFPRMLMHTALRWWDRAHVLISACLPYLREKLASAISSNGAQACPSQQQPYDS